MKKLFSIFVAALMSATMLAAETQYLPISVYAADDQESFPSGAKAMIENKLTQLLTKNGIAGIDYMGQFILTVTTTPLDKDVIPGPPAKIAEKMEMNLYIVPVLYGFMSRHGDRDKETQLRKKFIFMNIKVKK
jgi:hypothetical protein